MAEKTLFTKIMDGEIPADILYQDDQCIAIKDIQPAAPVHVLLIPRKPIPSLQQLSEEDRDLAAHLLLTIPRVAANLGIAEDGYRTIINTGEHGGQTVPHLHIHILGGSHLSEGSMAH